MQPPACHQHGQGLRACVGAGLVSGGQKETADRHKNQGHPNLELSPAFKAPGTDRQVLGLISEGDESSCYFCPEPCSNP